MNALKAWWRKWVWSWLKPLLKLTIAHPHFYDALALLLAYVVTAQGWFKPWIPLLPFGYLAWRIVSLRRRLKRFDR